MNETLATFFLTIAGAIITLLLGALVYFLKKWIDSTDSLTKSVNELKTAVALLQTNQTNYSQSCTNAHNIIDKRLNSHAERLNEHQEAITELQVKMETRKK